MPKGTRPARVKAGTTKVSADERKMLFVEAYLSNGKNGTRAAISAGFAEASAHVTASRLLREPKVAAEIAKRSAIVLATAQETTQLTVERVQQEIARLSFSDPRKLFRPDGTLIPIHELGDDAAATIASMEFTTIAGGDNPADADDDEEFEKRRRDHVVVRTGKLKTWDKGAALALACRHLGMFEKDNAQSAPNLSIRGVLVW